MNVLKVSQALDVKACRVAIVVSMFNEFITGRLESGCLKHLLKKGVLENHITIVEVPGAVELPLVAKKLAQSKKYDVVILLGCVIRGDTDHYDYVCQQVSYGCQHVALELGLPVIFGVLTTDNEEQALARVGGQHGHKGVDVAEAALAMFDIMKKIQ
jgi:6,7-dimethyl-8-ribityllumazine synthase